MNILINNNSLIILLTILVISDKSFGRSKNLRIYVEPSGLKCIWQGDAPFCFLDSSCPLRMTTMKTDKRGDGSYCWIGFKTYCCI